MAERRRGAAAQLAGSGLSLVAPVFLLTINREIADRAEVRPWLAVVADAVKAPGEESARVDGEPITSKRQGGGYVTRITAIFPTEESRIMARVALAGNGVSFLE